MWIAYASEHWPEPNDIESAVQHLHATFTDLLFDSEHQEVYGGLHIDPEECRRLSEIYSPAVDICDLYLQKKIDLDSLLTTLKKLNLQQHFGCLRAYVSEELKNQYFLPLPTQAEEEEEESDKENDLTCHEIVQSSSIESTPNTEYFQARFCSVCERYFCYCEKTINLYTSKQQRRFDEEKLRCNEKISPSTASSSSADFS